MINFIKNFFKRDRVHFLGVLGEQNSANVHEFSEMVGKASSPLWVEKRPDEWRVFDKQWQSKSSACVAFTVAKIAQILYFIKTGRKVKFSPGWIYKQRNPKREGMWIDNAVSIAGGGLPTEELYPSEGLDEAGMDSLPNLPYADGVAKEFAISINWVNIPLSFEMVASTIQATGKGVMLWFDFGDGEWFRRGIPYIRGSKLPYRHSVCAVDAVVYKGKRYLVIEDSAEYMTEFGHRKLIGEEFFSRCLLARYPINFKFDEKISKPKYSGSITSLQDCLKYEGVFPSNVPSTGNYGSTTTLAVKDFQKKYNIQQTGTVGPITEAKLLELYK